MPSRLKLSRPLCVFDIESTGRDPTTDRIVELAFVLIQPDGSRAVHEWRINPGMPIPAEAAAIHGITDADVADCPSFKQVAAEVAALLAGVDVSGFNARTYDVPMLECEFDRAGFKPSPLDDVRVLDSKEIFHAKEPRDLSAAVRFYCAEELVGAHGAKADAVAAADVLFAQIERYTDLPESFDALCEQFQPKERFVDPTRKLRLDEQGEPVINFGQYRGQRVIDVGAKKPDYLEWILNGEWHPRVRDAVAKVRDRLLAQRRPAGPAAANKPMSKPAPAASAIPAAPVAPAVRPQPTAAMPQAEPPAFLSEAPHPAEADAGPMPSPEVSPPVQQRVAAPPVVEQNGQRPPAEAQQLTLFGGPSRKDERR